MHPHFDPFIVPLLWTGVWIGWGQFYGLLEAYIEAVEHYFVQVVQNVAHQLVVHVEPVKKVVDWEHSVPQLATNLRLQFAHARADMLVFYPVADDKHIEPALPVADKYSRYDNKFYDSRRAYAFKNILGALGRVEQQILQDAPVLKLAVEAVADAAPAARGTLAYEADGGKYAEFFARRALRHA